ADNFGELFERVKVAAHGMLSTDVYSKLFEVAQDCGGGTFVEIGTAHGAATIVMALGAKASGKPFHIYSVDPFSGRYSSRTQFGSVQKNVKFVRRQFETFGVSEYIDIIVGGCQDLLASHQVDHISLLLLDADGRIDRDLSYLFSKLARRSKII